MRIKWERNAYRTPTGKRKGGDHLGGLAVGGRIIFKWSQRNRV
jgi:hypothetical protein